MPDPSRNPMTPEEVEELLKATLHGPLPQATVYRMMATLADWKGLAEARDKDPLLVAKINTVQWRALRDYLVLTDDGFTESAVIGAIEDARIRAEEAEGTIANMGHVRGRLEALRKENVQSKAELTQALAILNQEYSDKTVERKVYPLERLVISLGLDLEKAWGGVRLLKKLLDSHHQINYFVPAIGKDCSTCAEQKMRKSWPKEPNGGT